MKILITGGKTASALKLIKAFENETVLLGDYGEVPLLKTEAYSFEGLGEWNKEVLAHNLLTKCLDHGVDVLLPLYASEIEALSKSLLLFEEFGLKVLIPKSPFFNSEKFKDWSIFVDGKLIYASTHTQITYKKGLNGAYSFNAETEEFALISISNPL